MRRDNWKRRESVRELAYALADEGLFAWLDAFAFPPSTALKTKVDPKAELVERLLRYGYEQCKGLLALETENYGKEGIMGNWAEKEWTGKLDESEPPSLIFGMEKENNRLISDMRWSEVAKIIQGEMQARVPLFG